MGKAIITGAGGGGAGSDECTATRAEVLKGFQAITKDSDDELIDGTLELVGTAADSQVLSGQTYYNTDVKTKRTGTMANRGAVSQALNAGSTYTIPAGYHNGSGKVTANGLSGQTSATAAAGHILSGQTAWVNGNKITGNMANQGAVTASLNCGNNYTIPAGYHNGSGKVTANSLASQTSGNATAAQIYSGYTAWVNGSKIMGTMPAMGGQTITPGAAQQTISCAGYYMTGNIVVQGAQRYGYYTGSLNTAGYATFNKQYGGTISLQHLSFAPGFTPLICLAQKNNTAIISISTPWNHISVRNGTGGSHTINITGLMTASSTIFPVWEAGTYVIWLAGYY